MSDKIDDVVIPILRNLQSDVSMLKESVARIDARISSMDSYMAGFHSSLNWQNMEFVSLRGRIEHLEDHDKDNPKD